MGKRKIITIGRQFGSGGHEIGIKLAARLNINCYDNDILSVFIHAPFEDRVKRISNRLVLPENKAKDLIIHTDKKRSNYYNYYTNKKWSDSSSYDLCINSSKFSFDDCVNIIIDALDKRK